MHVSTYEVVLSDTKVELFGLCDWPMGQDFEVLLYQTLSSLVGCRDGKPTKEESWRQASSVARDASFLTM